MLLVVSTVRSISGTFWFHDVDGWQSWKTQYLLLFFLTTPPIYLFYIQPHPSNPPPIDKGDLDHIVGNVINGYTGGK